MKIALVSANLFDIGGVENHIRFIGQQLVRAGHELLLFKPTWSNDVSRSSALDDGIDSRVVDLGAKPYEQKYLRSLSAFAYLQGFMRRASFSFAAHRVRDAISDWDPELVWQHDFSSSWLGCRLLSKRYPVVLTNHTGEFLLLRRLPGSTQLLRRLMSHYEAVIGPSRELTPDFRANSHTIHNGVDLDFFTPLVGKERHALRDRLLGSYAHRFIVFCPRRWAPTKGVVYLAQAVRSILHRTDGHAHFVFAGSEYDLYRDYAATVRNELRGYDDHVEELGNLDLHRMRDWYRAADLVVIPSLMEAVSLAALEAMACCAPVLSTDVGGMPEIIEHDDTGMLVPARDSEALARAICRGVRDPDLLARVGNNGLNFVRSRHSWSLIAERTNHVLSSAFNARQQRGGKSVSAARTPCFRATRRDATLAA